MQIYDYNSLYLPLISLSLSTGILLVGVILFLYIYRYSRERLHLAILLIGFFTLIFVAAEVNVALCYLVKNGAVGRQFHRIQALAAVYYIFGIPFMNKYLLELNDSWQRLNSFLWRAGLALSIIITLLAFVSPDLFVSQSETGGAMLKIRWNIARGESGVLYTFRDITITILMIYGIVCLAVDLVWHRRVEFLLLPLAGIVTAVSSAFIDFMNMYDIIGNDTYPHNYFSFTSFGVTVFIVFSMIGVIKKFIDQTRNIEKAMKIESLGIFAGGIAHDFNNLLTAVIGNISMAQLSCDESDKDKVKILLVDAEKASLRAKDLTQQLLAFSRGGVPIMHITSIHEILMETVNFVLRGSKIRCEYNIDRDLKNVKGDRGQISQVVHNIIINAMQAMADGGVIRVEARNDSSRIWRDYPSTKDTHFIRINITDEGTGIPRKLMDRIFDPYFTTKDTGNGLGLSISYSIIKNHHGYIFVKSKVGEGTTFEIFLPATDDGSAETGCIYIEADVPEGSVVLMDDDELILEVGEKMLRRMGFEVFRAKDGKEAIDIYKDRKKTGTPPCCMIMDLTIPGGMGGREAVSVLKKMDPALKVIVSSGYSNDPIMARYQEYGFDGVVAKPYRFEELRGEVVRVFRQ